MSKRILIFSLAYYPDMIGGAEVAVKEITDRMRSDEFEFDMVTLRMDSRFSRFEKIGNVNVHRVGWGNKFWFPVSKLFFPFTAFFKAIRLNRKNKYSVIWSIMANRAGFSALFFKFFYPETKFVLTLQEGDTLDYPEKRMGMLRPILAPFFKRIFTKADIIQTISVFLADWAKKMGAKGEIVVVPNGVDIEKFSKKIEQNRIIDIRKKLNFSEKDKLIITVSRLVEKNAVDDVIRALALLPNEYKFIVIGKGPDLGSLEKMAEEKGVAERVRFIGFMDYKEIPAYLKSSDIFVRPSLTEGMGNVFVEAMAAEIPVIATPVGGIVDFLFDPETNPDKESTGLFCNVRDPQNIADKVLRISTDSKLRERIVGNAFKLAKEKYDWNLIAKRMASILSS